LKILRVFWSVRFVTITVDIALSKVRGEAA
jgi:hypothetical protein